MWSKLLTISGILLIVAACETAPDWSADGSGDGAGGKEVWSVENKAAGTGDEAAERQGRADGRILPGVVFCMAQPLDAVAHDQPHGAGIVIRPDGFRAIALFGLEQALGDLIEGGIPRNWHEIIRALGPDPAQRPSQSARMMDAFCVSCDLGADHAVGVAVTARATQRPTRSRPRICLNLSSRLLTL